MLAESVSTNFDCRTAYEPHGQVGVHQLGYTLLLSFFSKAGISAYVSYSYSGPYLYISLTNHLNIIPSEDTTLPSFIL